MKIFFFRGFLLMIVTLGLTAAQAQNSILFKGLVSDTLTSLPIDGATVTISGSQDFTTQTDSLGRFVMSLPAGNYNLAVSYINYLNYKTKFAVKTGETVVERGIKLAKDNKVLEGVVVSGRRSRESETVLNQERKAATIVVQKIGAQEMSVKGISNVAEGVNKIVGVSTVGNSDLFVRGLGDRYNNAMLNGLPIPSTNPDVKLIPLDIFPSSVVENIAVVKSYTSPYYGDFSGGTIDITTKSSPARPFFKIELSGGYNSITTGNDFLSSKGQNFMSKQGFGKGQRTLPAELLTLGARSENLPGQSVRFNTPWSPETIKAPMNHGIALSGGKTFSFENGYKLGLIASLTHKNKFRYQEGISAIYNADKVADYKYNTENYYQQNNTTGLLSLNLRPNNANSYTFTSLFVNDANTDIYNGWGQDMDLGDLYFRRNTLIQNTLISNQIAGVNKLSDDQSTINWAVGYTKTLGAMPDRITNGFRGTGPYTFITAQSGAENQRYSYDLDDNELSGKLELKRKTKDRTVFKEYAAGIDGRYKFRTFDVTVISGYLNGLTGMPVDINNVDATLTPGTMGTEGATGKWAVRNEFNASNNYEANLKIGAPYIDMVWNWNNKWNLEAGVRLEVSQQTISYRQGNAATDAPFENKDINAVDVLPGATLKNILSPKSNFLIAASRTISRPLFVESAPFRLNSAAGTAETEGNPNLKNSSIINLDFKYEQYPSLAELFAVSVFGKYISDPIERMQLASSEQIFSYVNTGTAYIAGVEVEFKRNLGSLFNAASQAVNNMTIGFNGSYMYNRIKVDREKILETSGKPVAPTNTSRPLFGASPYLINFDYTYKAKWNQNSFTTFALVYSVFGKRLFVAGSQGAGDIYEMPVNTLNAAINTTLSKKWNIGISFDNILNPNVIYNQEFSNGDLEFSRFKRGMVAGISLGYNF